MTTLGKTSIYLGPEASRVLAERTDLTARDEEGSPLRTRSGLVNAMIDRYGEVAHRAMPIFSVAEWCCIFDSLNGVWVREPAALLTSIWAEVADHISLNGADDKWGVDPELWQRVRALEYAEIVAVVDAAERFWGSDQIPDQTWHDLIAGLVGAEHITT